MKTVTQVKQALSRTASRQLLAWLCDPATATWDTPLGRPTEQQAQQAGAAAWTAWAQTWLALAAPGVTVTTQTVQWQIRGQQLLPTRFEITGLWEIAEFLGATKSWQQFCAQAVAIHHLLKPESPQLSATKAPFVLAKTPAWEATLNVLWRFKAQLAQLNPSSWQRVLTMTEFLLAHPDSGLPARAIPAPGIDTKWLRSSEQLVTALVALVREQRQLPGGRELGLVQLDTSLVQLIFADPQLRPTVGQARPRQLALPLSQLAELYDSNDPLLRQLTVVIVENLVSFLSLPDRPHTIYLWGSGRQAVALAQSDWLGQTNLHYWGDLDSHGFGILAFLRRASGWQLPSLLMDSATLLQHQELLVPEPNPLLEDLDSFLTPGEQQTLALLREPPQRLEQERINFALVLKALAALEP